ncbi:MAG: UDP-N-acetylenolpyruvoylglucosamine reductase [Candidatus Vogelbacteria bacterium RIFOXYD1_FULL_44_32]|uniref:UDP-N-acetylenolpyruvoylglucosamine reductase n=1 Tax=Candidatus Vogelbacteria bacterium RIFOXYD1_FULL_44_32 TaxID=1802438 RepID=A0A1G2QCD1_9BACT|nr:MAG: UDP-N-acetylenolpyruvoylglucosamine reductase [Candidatus Vogelbacteria bacterium RIFOXYD1_FULL_44_32]
MQAKLLKKIFPELKTKVKIAPFTAFDIGGTAPFWLEIRDKHKLVEVIKKAQANHLPYFVFAGGSNLVFPDKLPKKIFICYRAKPRAGVTHFIESKLVYAEAGLPLAILVGATIKNGLAGFEALSGIPGTVGGAIFGNAGAYGQTISDKLVEIEIFDGQDIKWVPVATGQFSYRASIFKKKDWLILGGRWSLAKGEAKTLNQKSREIIKMRNKKYAPGIKCPGSYFKNLLASDLPKKVLKQIPAEKIIGGKVPTGYLLEVVGVKGLKRGKIMVPDYHANLILNTGGGKAVDVLALANIMKQKVKDRFNIKIEEEVRVI